jgi:hypothetical protein
VAKKPSKPRKPAKPSLDQRIRTDSKLRARVLANPGLRSKLSTSTLAKYRPAAAKQRTLNARLNAPITPGSSITERDLAHEAQAAQAVKYGPAESDLGQQIGRSQQIERDTGSYFDEYQRQIAAHAQAVAAFQQGAQAGMQQAATGITGLAGTQAAELQGQANQAAAQQGVAPAGDVTGLASQAAQTRQGLMASFQGQQAQTGAATSSYADALANTVAPGQKLSALAQARGRTGDLISKRSDLRREEGAFNQQFRSDRRSEEFKNQLAMQTLGANVANQQADNAIAAAKTKADIESKTPAAKAAAAGATAAANTGAKYGYTAHQWALLGPTARNKIIKAAKAVQPGTASDSRYTSGPFAGMLKSDVNALSNKEAQAKVDAYQNKKDGGGTATTDKKAFRQKYGVDLQPTSAHNTFKDQVGQAVSVLGHSGKKGGRGVITTQQLVDAMTQGGEKGIPKLPAVVIRAALEIKRYGHLTPGTANRLHHSGYSVGQLGYKTGPAVRGGSRRDPRPTGTAGGGH